MKWDRISLNFNYFFFFTPAIMQHVSRLCTREEPDSRCLVPALAVPWRTGHVLGPAKFFAARAPSGASHLFLALQTLGRRRWLIVPGAGCAATPQLPRLSRQGKQGPKLRRWQIGAVTARPCSAEPGRNLHGAPCPNFDPSKFNI